MDNPVTKKALSRFWRNMKLYIDEHTYPKVSPPDLYFDPETAALYQGKPSVGYDFVVSDGRLYYKERGGMDA